MVTRISYDYEEISEDQLVDLIHPDELVRKSGDLFTRIVLSGDGLDKMYNKYLTYSRAPETFQERFSTLSINSFKLEVENAQKKLSALEVELNAFIEGLPEGNPDSTLHKHFKRISERMVVKIDRLRTVIGDSSHLIKKMETS